MEKRELTCIGCPMGCQITVELNEGEVVSVTGNTCGIGDKYARNEVTHPERTVTSTAVILVETMESCPMIHLRLAIPLPLLSNLVVVTRGVYSSQTSPMSASM